MNSSAFNKILNWILLFIFTIVVLAQACGPREEQRDKPIELDEPYRQIVSDSTKAYQDKLKEQGIELFVAYENENYTIYYRPVEQRSIGRIVIVWIEEHYPGKPAKITHVSTTGAWN